MRSIRVAFRCRAAAHIALLLGCVAAQTAGAEVQAIQLPIREQRLVCTASDSYCKASAKVTFSYPGKAFPAQDTVLIECVAHVAVKQASKQSESIESYRRAFNAAVSYGAIDQDIEVPVNPPPGSTSMELKKLGCTLAATLRSQESPTAAQGGTRNEAKR